MKFKKTFITFTSIWLIFNILIEWKIQLLKDRHAIFLFFDLLLSIPILILVFNFFSKIYTNFKYIKNYATVSTLLFYPTLWLVIYPLMPYGNHLITATPDGERAQVYRYYFYSQNASAFILKIKGVSCDFSYLEHSGLRFVKYTSGTNEAISILMENIKYRDKELSQEQEHFLFNQLNETINQCDVNVEVDGNSPLFDAIIYRNLAMASALIQRGANVNKFQAYPDKKSSSTLLYRAETVLKSEQDEAKKQSLIKIIELLKQAGAKSEIIELPTK